MSTILDQICADKRAEVDRRQGERSLEDLDALAGEAPAVRGFADALWGAVMAMRYGLIAEIKKASPSAGLIRSDFDPAALARAYADGGATGLSVLTDTPWFQGDDTFLRQARDATDLPVLRKDFLIDPYQVVEARAIGADAVLLIAAALSDAQLREMMTVAQCYDMDVLLEVHDQAEMERALLMEPRILGINNRDLATMTTDLATTETLAPWAPEDALVVCESGLKTKADLDRMAMAGARCFLVGEHLMGHDDVAAATRALLEGDGA